RREAAAYRPASQQSAAAQIPAEEGAKAKALLDRVVAAKGGLARLKSLKSIAAVTAARSLGQEAFEAQTTTYLKYPDHVRIETVVPQATQIQVFDGQRAWVKDPQGVHDVPAFVVNEFRGSLKRDVVTLLLDGESGAVRTRLLPDVRDEAGMTH